jgi:hypothetical protein
MKLYGYSMPSAQELILFEENDKKMPKMVAAQKQASEVSKQAKNA